MRTFLYIIFLFIPVFSFSQVNPNPNNGLEVWEDFISPVSESAFFIPEPPEEPVRQMAEWEELEAIVVTWKSFKDILVEIIRHAKEEVKVYVVVSNSGVLENAQNKLSDNGVSLDNIEFIMHQNNSVWIRDYGHSPVYTNDVGDQLFIDWIYNREREFDDVIPAALSDALEIPLYSTTEGDYKLVNIGGNFQSDGLGTGFSSRLILEENGPGNDFGVGPHTEAAIDNLMFQYHGVNKYIKFPQLEWDEISHIDMHAHLIDEETWMIGEYPPGVADGPQIEENIEFLRDSFETPFFSDYQFERIIMPPDADGKYPDEGGDYRTYTNFTFVNNTILVPFYEAQYDSMAMEVFNRLFPGYNIVGIDCNSMIAWQGAIHCITKEIGVKDPLWIVHQKFRDIDDNDSWMEYPLSAQLKHRHSVTDAELYWTTDLSEGYEMIEMEADIFKPNTWNAAIPHQPNGSIIYYYIKGHASTGKTQVRPLPAPEAYYHFTVTDLLNSTEEEFQSHIGKAFPNPTGANVTLPIVLKNYSWVKVDLVSIEGKHVNNLYNGNLTQGESTHTFDVSRFPPGAYFLKVQTGDEVFTQKIIIQ